MVPTIFSSVLYKTYAKISPFSHPSAKSDSVLRSSSTFCTLSTQKRNSRSLLRDMSMAWKSPSVIAVVAARAVSRGVLISEMILSGLSIFSPYCAAVGSTGFRPNLSVTTRRSLVLILVRSKTTRGFSGTCPVSAMTFRSLI